MTPLARLDVLPLGPLPRLGRRLLLRAETTSTNADLLANAAALEDGTIALAEFQTRGRGRFGRPWTAPPGSALLMSVLLHEPEQTPLARWAGLIGAVATAEAIEQSTSCRPALRWPNDVMLDGRKVAGVLAESTPLPRDVHGARRAIVIGIGVNCLQGPGDFPGELADRATSLQLGSTPPIDRAVVARALLARLDARVREACGSWSAAQAVRNAWAQRCYDVGATITVRHDGQTFQGVVIEVAASGDLLIELPDGVRRTFGADTTTRLS